MNSESEPLTAIEWALIFVLLLLGILVVQQLVTPAASRIEFVETAFVSPFTDDLGAKDGDYNWANTAVYAGVLISSVVVIAGLLRIAGIGADDRLLLAMTPWVVWAALARVLEDTGFQIGSNAALFISPAIHFHTAAWVSSCLFLGSMIVKSPPMRAHLVEKHESQRASLVATILVCIHFFLVIRPNLLIGRGIHLELLGFIGLFVGVISPWYVSPRFHHRSRVSETLLLSTGVGASASIMGILLQYVFSPWSVSSGGSVFIIALPVIFSIGICSIMVVKTRKDREELAFHGLIPGVLPRGITMAKWMDGESSSKPVIESHSSRAALGSPMVVLPVLGQLLDGSATWIGIDFLGYSEKHVVGSQIMLFGQNYLWDGGWLFFVVKIGMAALVGWVLAANLVEHRQRHLRLLISLALMAVGLAPGIRDLGRIALGV